MQAAPRSFLAKIALLVVWCYRHMLSGYILHWCRFRPSCSEYAAESVRRFGALRGVKKASWRILRCQPFSPGGFDPVR